MNVLFQFWKERKSKLLVCMSAASNVTGIITNVDTVSAIAHSHGAFVVFDCASAGTVYIYMAHLLYLILCVQVLYTHA